MTNLICEVIGCSHDAAWRRVGGAKREDYLCGQHRQWFVALHPAQEAVYIPLEGCLTPPADTPPQASGHRDEKAAYPPSEELSVGGAGDHRAEKAACLRAESRSGQGSASRAGRYPAASASARVRK